MDVLVDTSVRSPAQFALLRARLRAFPDIELETADYEEAAAFARDFGRRML